MMELPTVFPGTRAEALERLNAFLPLASQYAARRNHVLAGHPHVSRLSPAVRHRFVLEQEVIEAALARHPFAAVEKFVQEVFWRTYWKGWLELRPGVWRAYRKRLAELASSASQPRAAAVAAGNSGVAIMDRFARELVETGYLHNHARMWFAAFWVHVERLPWELGADFFYRHLLDADPASNTLSWRWVAGLQTKGKTYLVRRSNVEKYADPAWLTDTAGLDRLDDALAAPTEVPETADLTVVPLEPLPMRLPAQLGRVGLWIHGDDLLPECSPLAELQPISGRAFLSRNLVARHGLSPLRETYLERALTDAVERAAIAFAAPVLLERIDDLAEAAVNWVRSGRLDTVVALQPAVGPLRDILPSLRAELEAVGVRLLLLRRSFDTEHWPLARSGYFGFWEQVKRRRADGVARQLELM